MKIWQAIILTLVILGTCAYISTIIGSDLPTQIMILVTSLWVAFDSSQIQLQKYKSGISYNPFILFIGCIGLWIIAFPWYLSVRYKIKNGLAQRKN